MKSVMFWLGYLVGLSVLFFDLDKGSASYHDTRVVERDGNVIVRAVRSPSNLDDHTIEVIINGKLVSRKKAEDFNWIWEHTK